MFGAPALALASIFASSDTPTVPGEPETKKSLVGETVASAIQNFAPVNQFKTHLATIKCYADDPTHQEIVHEYVSHLNEDVMQSVMYDSDSSEAKLIGVEYTITEKIYNELPAEEKCLWHPRLYEVKSGLMVAPRMPRMMENKLMKDLAPTFAKSVSIWQVDSDRLPIGVPHILRAPTRDGIIRPELIRDRDKKLGIDIEEEKKARKDIPITTLGTVSEALWDREGIQIKPIKLSLSRTETGKEGRESFRYDAAEVAEDQQQKKLHHYDVAVEPDLEEEHKKSMLYYKSPAPPGSIVKTPM
jgi:hypothetical protein